MLLQMGETSFVKKTPSKTRDVSIFRERLNTSHCSGPRHGYIWSESSGMALNGVSEGRPRLCASALKQATGHRVEGSPRVRAGLGVCVSPWHGERACGEP